MKGLDYWQKIPDCNKSAISGCFFVVEGIMHENE